MLKGRGSLIRSELRQIEGFVYQFNNTYMDKDNENT